MSSDLLLAKLIPPQLRTDFVSRPRLIHRIGSSKRGYITLITAPAGYGKTTLLAEWCGRQKIQIAWLSLDAADNDPVLFWQYVAATFGIAETSSASPRANDILNALVRLPKQIALILDDLHVIHSKVILNELAHFIEHVPPRVQIVLATRSTPSLPLARWRARGQLNELEPGQLAFTRNETRAFLQTTMQFALDEETISNVANLTDGWAAGLQLVALSLENKSDVQSPEIERAHIFDYLAAEVFSRLSRARQTFLMQTGLLERFTVELANAVTQRTDRAKLVQGLVHANLFLSCLHREQTWYRYHPLFAEFLQKRLHQMNPAQEKLLHVRAAHWFAKQKLYPDAIRHALYAEDYQNVSGWIDQACETAMERGQLTTIKQWLDALPQKVVSQNPSLELWYAWLFCLEQRFDEMESHLQNAERRASQLARQDPCWKQETKTVQGKSAAVRARAAVLRHDEQNVLKWSARALDRLPPAIRNERSVVWLTRAQSFERLGKFEEAAEAYTQAEHIGRAADHAFIYLGVLQAYARLLVRLGKTSQAKEWLTRALVVAHQKNLEPLAAPAQELMTEISDRQVPFAADSLSAREREILQWLAQGETNPQIAKRLQIGVGTVNWHTKNIYKKLGVRNRTEAAAIAHLK